VSEERVDRRLRGLEQGTGVRRRGAPPRRRVPALDRATLTQLKWAIVTVAGVLGLAYVMNQSGQTTTLGLWLAGAGSAFAFFSAARSPARTRRRTRFFGALQVTAAKDAGLSPTPMAAANSSGGVLGKMISLQTSPSAPRRWVSRQGGRRLPARAQLEPDPPASTVRDRPVAVHGPFDWMVVGK
jgi:hypothetical protein